MLTDEFYREAFESQIQMRLRTGSAKPANLAWNRVTTGVPASLNLAKRLAERDGELLQVDPAFRPLVMRFH